MSHRTDSKSDDPTDRETDRQTIRQLDAWAYPVVVPEFLFMLSFKIRTLWVRPYLDGLMTRILDRQTDVKKRKWTNRQTDRLLASLGTSLESFPYSFEKNQQNLIFNFSSKSAWKLRTPNPTLYFPSFIAMKGERLSNSRSQCKKGEMISLHFWTMVVYIQRRGFLFISSLLKDIRLRSKEWSKKVFLTQFLWWLS